MVYYSSSQSWHEEARWRRSTCQMGGGRDVAARDPCLSERACGGKCHRRASLRVARSLPVSASPGLRYAFCGGAVQLKRRSPRAVSLHARSVPALSGFADGVTSRCPASGIPPSPILDSPCYLPPPP